MGAGLARTLWLASLGTAATLAALALAPGAEAAVTAYPASDPGGAMAVALSMARNEAATTLVTGATWLQYPTAAPGAGRSDAPIGPLFSIVDGATFAVLTSGDAAEATMAQSASATIPSGGPGAGSANDVVSLAIDLNVAAPSNCLRFTFQFLSEEYPVYVGSQFNDAFVAELDVTTWSTVGGVVTAPDNFAFATGGVPVSINSVPFTTTNAALAASMPSVYDGGSEVWTAQTPVTPGAHVLYLTIFDNSDQSLDSAAFIDDLRAVHVPTPLLCQPGIVPPPSAPPEAFLSSPGAGQDCLDPAVQLLGTATDDDGAIAAYVLEFGDGTQATGPWTGPLAVSHIYPAPGAYLVRLTVYDAEGSPGTATLTVFAVGEPACCPVLDAIPDLRVRAGDLVSVTARSTDLDGGTPAYALERTRFSATLDAASGLFRWQTGPDDEGLAAFRIRVTEPGTTCEDTEDFLVHVLGDADPPAPDADDDGVQDAADNCPGMGNRDQADADGDGEGDACEGRPAGQGPQAPPPVATPREAPRDPDLDGVAGAADNCPATANVDQSDLDLDGLGDLCDADQDGDGVPDAEGQCPPASAAGCQATGAPVRRVGARGNAPPQAADSPWQLPGLVAAGLGAAGGAAAVAAWAARRHDRR